MTNRDPGVQTPSWSRTGRFAVGQIPHCVLFLVVGAALVRLSRLDDSTCRGIVITSGLLAVGYASGLALWNRLGTLPRGCWVTVLLVLWAVLVALAPPPSTGAYAWCAVPMACLALRAPGQRRATVALPVVTIVLIGQLTRTTDGFDPEMVLIPVAAVWGTVALYRGLQRDAAQRQRLLAKLQGTRHILAEEQRRAGVLKERERLARDLHDTLAQELMRPPHADARGRTRSGGTARHRTRPSACGCRRT